MIFSRCWVLIIAGGTGGAVHLVINSVKCQKDLQGF